MKNIVIGLLILFNIILFGYMIAQSNTTSYSFTLIEIISIITAIISICLGVFAIWLTLHLKKEADSLNEKTNNLLMEIKSDAKSITNGVFNEMKEWGNFGRKELTSNSLSVKQGGTEEPNDHKKEEKKGGI